MKRKPIIPLLVRKPNRLRALYIISRRKIGKITDERLIVILCAAVFLLQLFIMVTAIAAPLHATAQESVKHVPAKFAGLPIGNTRLNDTVGQARLNGLQIGQVVPDVTITNIINYKTPTAKISDFKGKLLILDFWATWCSSCIAKFPEMAALQNEFGNKVQVLLVNSKNNRDTEARVRNFISKRTNPDGSPFTLPTVVNDGILADLFPHKVIPHYAWIGPEGTLLATTSADQVTSQNVTRMLEGHVGEFRLKKDIDLDRPLFSSADFPEAGIRHYSTFLKGQIDGLPSGSRFRTKNGVSYGRVMTNLSLATMYRVTVRALFPDLPSRNILFEVTDKQQLAPEFTNLPLKEWQLQNFHSYELQMQLESSKHLHQYILDDLNRYSGYFGRMERRKLPSLIVKRKGAKFNGITDGGSTLAQVIKILNNSYGIGEMIVAGTGLELSTPMGKPLKIETRAALDEYLHNHGLYAVPSTLETDVFVIRKSDHPSLLKP